MKRELSNLNNKLSHLSVGHLPFSQREEKKAFTLVELIVVITILAILGTIGFISIQSYTVYARDSVRLSNLRTIESSLKIQYTQGGAYAVPDDSVNITASGTLIRQQGVFGKNAVRTVKLSTDASEDPLTGEYYDYVVDNNLSQYQLAGYMEGEEASLLSETYALNSESLQSMGQDLGIIFSGGLALHRDSANVGSDIDIMSPASELTVVFDNDDEISSSDGTEIFSNIYNRDGYLLGNRTLAALDESLVMSVDMGTINSDGKLEDSSGYGNHLECQEYNDAGTLELVNCNSVLFDEGWRGEGRSIIHDGLGSMSTPSSDSINFNNTNPFTVVFNVKFTNHNRAPLLGEYTNETCGRIYNEAAERYYYKYRNFILNKAHSINLWFPCSANQNNHFTLRIADTQGHGVNTEAFNYQKDEWYNIVAIYDGNNLQQFFMNGYEIGKRYETPQWESEGNENQRLYVGLNTRLEENGGIQSQFTIDEFRIYNRVLSPVELKKMYDIFINEY